MAERVINHEVHERFPRRWSCCGPARHVLDLDDVPPPIEHEARDALAGLPEQTVTG